MIFSLHLSCLIIWNFESSQAVDTFVEGFAIWLFSIRNASENNDTELRFKVFSLHEKTLLKLNRFQLTTFQGDYIF